MRRGTGNRPPNAKDDQAETERVKRRERAWRLRIEHGLSIRQIAAKLGVGLGTAQRDLEAARAECKPENVDELREEASAALLVVRRSMLKLAKRGDPQAASAAIKAIAEHAKLNGLHAPEKRELTGKDGAPLSLDVTASPERAREIFADVFGTKVAETLPDAGTTVRSKTE